MWVAWTLTFVIACVTVPIGVSGAVFLLPVQIGVLGIPSPAVTPTNLLYNVVALPVVIWRMRGSIRWTDRLVRLLLLGTVPGVLVGVALRLTVLRGESTFRLLLAVLLAALGSWLLVGSPTAPPRRGWVRRSGPAWLVAAAAVTGMIGGVYGIGGGSIIGPALVALGLSVRRVAPAALAVTLTTSVVGLAGYLAANLSLDVASAAPNWAVGVWLGSAGLAGGLAGLLVQARLPEVFLRRLLGSLALLIAIGYLAAVLAG